MNNPKNIAQQFRSDGRSWHLPLIPLRPIYDAPACIIRGEPERRVLSDQRTK